MAPLPDDAPATLRAAVDRMLALRAEHKPILDKIVADAGMQPETRKALVEHLRLEEDEKLDAIARLTPARAAEPKPARPAGGAAHGAAASMTVGSLRRVQAPPREPAAPRGSVGSLRKP